MSAIGWALSPTDVMEPLAVIAASRSIFIVNVGTNTIVGKLRGHGGVSSIDQPPHLECEHELIDLYVIGNIVYRCTSQVAIYVFDHVAGSDDKVV